ncbi:DUF4298 domain-containing protein [Carnobacteriaceae bacterium zg-ZUI252]|nr:DUF4298 domain-containing protein [Carnobacteriaceae bacterium zg-ZUI252]MBS4770338.1 DUF4298 domain-containing protein [Carnobacteriaceae bacterium zg-ZUI240]
MDAKQRVEQMELSMDNVSDYVAQLETLLKQFDTMHQTYLTFRHYYGSSDWYEDRELPLNIKSGVLSEDLPYEVIGQYRDVALNMLETATKILKDY